MDQSKKWVKVTSEIYYRKFCLIPSLALSFLSIHHLIEPLRAETMLRNAKEIRGLVKGKCKGKRYNL